MAKLVGTWILGDTMKDLVYTVKNADGAARDLTDATVVLQGKRQKDVSLAIAVTGVVDPDQITSAGKGIVTFSSITAGLSLGNAVRQTFECHVKVSQTGLIGYTNPFDIVVEVWP